MNDNGFSSTLTSCYGLNSRQVYEVERIIARYPMPKQDLRNLILNVLSDARFREQPRPKI